MITVTIEGQPWDDPAAPWTPAVHTFTHPIEALQMISAADHYLNTRPVAWRADTPEEREEIRRMLRPRPYLHYVLGQEATTGRCGATVHKAGEAPHTCDLDRPCPIHEPEDHARRVEHERRIWASPSTRPSGAEIWGDH